MDDTTKHHISDAHRRQTLFGAHIDFQAKFNNCAYSAAAFAKGADFADALRTRSVENIWCAMRGGSLNHTARASTPYPEGTPSQQSGRIADIPLLNDDAFDTVHPHQDDALYIKNTTSLPHNRDFADRFKAVKGGVFLLDGVSANTCILHSARAFTEISADAQVVLVTDAINIAAANAQSFAGRVRAGLSPDKARRIHHATTQEILLALEKH